MNDVFDNSANAKMLILEKLSFGARTAEEEADILKNYFVQTDQWKRILKGEVDIIYGAKGAGKSAIYTLLQNYKEQLFSKNILLATAENPRGATVFRNIVSDPPASERDFISFWKIYIVGLLGKVFQEYDFNTPKAKKFIGTLIECGLLPTEGGLARLLKVAKDFATRWTKRRARVVTWTASFDPTTSIPIPIRTVEYAQEVDEEIGLANFDPDEVLQQANDVLQDEGFICWSLFDRLDVAFEDSKELEQNALRALFRVYNDMRGLSRIGLKIFVRDDIWRRITETGFSEASHITRTVTIKWDNESLLNLAVRRLLSNPDVVKAISVSTIEVLGSLERQRDIFYKIFPKQIDSGPNKPQTFEWILGRTKDGTGVNTPRELIHFLTEIRDEQIRRLEQGDTVPDGNFLFNRVVFKTALKIVSPRPCLQSMQNCDRQLWLSETNERSTLLRRLLNCGRFKQRKHKRWLRSLCLLDFLNHEAPRLSLSIGSPLSIATHWKWCKGRPSSIANHSKR